MLNSRVFYLSIAIFCFALLGGAYYLQHVEKQFPCPFCILQRYAYLSIGLVCLIAAAHGPKSALLDGQRIGLIQQRFYGAFVTLFAATGIALAVWQLLKASNDKSCGADAVAEFVNGLPPAGWYSDYFFANGGCSDVWPPILGVSLAMWSAICFSALAIIGVLSIKTTLKK
jgi:protein dithiol:quinone oxidoreductase